MNATTSDPKKKLVMQVAAVFAFLGVALGAFGAHALQKMLEEGGHVEHWQTATYYHLIHSLAALAIMGNAAVKAMNGWLFLIGVFLFSGSLYGISLGWSPAVFGPITPLGGLCFLAAWAWSAVSLGKS